MAKKDSVKNTEDSQPKQRRSLKKFYILLVALLVLVAGAGFAGYQKYDALKKENQKLSDPQEAAKQETQRIKTQVSQLIDVPQNEDPTIASVVDVSKLNKQPFFAKAQNGDKVLMYSQAKKAILYRPSTNKIIEVAPINIGNNTQDPSKQDGTAE